jgi:hypothetical protein
MPLASLVHDRLVALIAGGGAELDWSALGLLQARDAGLAPSLDAPLATLGLPEARASASFAVDSRSRGLRHFRFCGPLGLPEACARSGLV